MNMKETVELKPRKKTDGIRRFSNKELRLTKESMGKLLKTSENCGPIRKNSYHHVSGIVGLAYILFIIRVCHLRTYVIVTSITKKRCC